MERLRSDTWDHCNVSSDVFLLNLRVMGMG